jgi:hypothetical protein
MYLYFVHNNQNTTVLNYDSCIKYKLEASIAGFVNSLGSFHLYSCVLVQWSVNNHQDGCFVQACTLLISEQVYFTKTKYKATWSSTTIPLTHYPSLFTVCKPSFRADTVTLHKASDMTQTLVHSTFRHFSRTKFAAWFPSPPFRQAAGLASFHTVTHRGYWEYHLIYDDKDLALYPQSVFISMKLTRKL